MKEGKRTEKYRNKQTGSGASEKERRGEILSPNQHSLVDASIGEREQLILRRRMLLVAVVSVQEGLSNAFGTLSPHRGVKDLS